MLIPPETAVGPSAEVTAEVEVSPWAPLRIQIFRWLWIAGLVSNVGTYMHNVGASWFVGELTRSPTTVALLQTVYAAPGFIFALVAGALADVIDKRKMLIAVQLLMAVCAALLGALTLTHNVNVGWLLALTFLISIGGTFNMPPWSAITPEVVPRDILLPAIALNSVSGNVAQSLGPAVAGVIIAAAGPGAVFIVNAVSFLAVIVVIWAWHRDAPVTTLPAEHVGSAVRSGVRYVVHSPALLMVLLRVGCVVAFTSALAALLPILARTHMHANAGQFGLLEASLGAGAVAIAVVLPRLRKAIGTDGLILAGSILGGVGLIVTAMATAVPLACVGLAVAGAGQLTAMTTLFAAYQGVLPAWVRGRGLAVVMLIVWVVTSPMAVVWGAIASASSAPMSVGIAGVGMIAVGLVLAPFIHVSRMDKDDVTPMPTMLDLAACEPAPADGPVLVTIEWRVDPVRVTEFTEAMRPIHRLRRRDGAIRWGLFEDVVRPGHMLESFEVASWAEHERQHGRATAADALAQEPARSMLIDGDPVVTHLVAPPRPVRPARQWMSLFGRRSAPPRS
jgi:MFS family permease